MAGSEMRILGRRLLLLSVVASMVWASSAAAAETRSFLSEKPLFPSGNAQGTVGPANEYPSTIVVTGVAGTVTKVTVSVIDLESGNADDIDMALVGPNQEAVMLMSDACGDHILAGDNWTFDDAAPAFLPDSGPCASGQQASFEPSNYFGGEPEPDDLTPGGGPPGPYLDQLAFLAGGIPDGEWKLYVTDDDPDVVGFTLDAWALNLEIEPPPPGPTPSPAESTPPISTTPAVPAPPSVRHSVAHRTGRRAAALGRCKAKKTKRARAKCRQRARKLPL
jgi:subtilisin-like proprotein convertase family protein